MNKLPVDEVESLWQAITVLEAQETLMRYNAAIYPKLRTSAQREEHKKVFKAAFPTKLYPPESTITPKELAQKLRVRG